MYAAKVYVRSVDGRVRSTRTILFFSTGVIGVRRKYGDIEGASSGVSVERFHHVVFRAAFAPELWR